MTSRRKNMDPLDKALERAIKVEEEGVKNRRNVLARLKEIQQYANKHGIDIVQFGSNDVTSFSGELKKLIHDASRMVDATESTVHHLEGKRGSGAPFRINRAENNATKRLIKEMERKMRRSKERNLDVNK
jgi:hypothetical protein